MAFSNGPTIVTNGLILALDADDQTSYTSGSTTWTDLTGNGWGGDLIGSASFSSGPDRFDTNCTTINNTGYLSTSSQLTFDDASSYTFDFWVKMRANAQVTAHSLLGRGSTSPWLPIYTGTTTGFSWYLRFRDSAATYNNFTTISDTNIQNWTNITITADTSRNLSLYVNGVFRETIVLTTSLFYVRRIAGGYSSGGNFYNFQGSLASAKLYNTTLSAAEIQQNYNALKSRFGIT
jgi:hypothetical protein